MMAFTVKEEHPKLSVWEIIINEREFIYPLLFYAAGLLVGSFSYGLLNSDAFIKMLGSLFERNQNDFGTLFVTNFALYISVFMVSLLLGMCLLGYPVIHVIPLLMGVVIAIKVTYYYAMYAVKGIGYSLLMIIPEASLLVCAIMYMVSSGTKLSKFIFDKTSNRGAAGELEIKKLLTHYLIYASVVTFSAFINSLLTFLLKSIIKI